MFLCLCNMFIVHCHFSMGAVPGYDLVFPRWQLVILWCLCTAELHVLNDEYTCQWHLPISH